MKKEEMREAILQLKEVKKERELTSEEIHRMVTEAGFDLSLASIKRVFKPGAEELSFRYRDTILPIVQVLLAVREETTEENRPTDTEVDALKSLLILKEKMIEDLTEQVTRLEQQREDDKFHLAIYKTQIEATAEQLKLLTEQIRRKDKFVDELLTKWSGV